jgi:alcohol dehydrogenase
MYRSYCRIYQTAFKVVSNFLPWRKPEVLEGVNSLQKLPSLIQSKGIKKVLIVTDQGIVSLGLMEELLENLATNKINYALYRDTVPNPTIENIEEALKIYHDNKCQAIIAFGGGSPMDCAKGVAARVARPKKSVQQLKGVLKVLKKTPPLFAIPTTAGTGSEATLAAVVTDSSTHEKYAIMDTALIPHYAVLDPMLTVKLPPQITAATGMDALTHAIEAYIGRSNTDETINCSRNAVQLIFSNLYQAYQNGENIEARANMQKAAYLAGIAFTRAYVGYVHAIAHTLGGFYNTPHGLANAVILPHVLEYYGEAVHQPLAELADLIGITAKDDLISEKADKFIEAIKKLNQDMEIPTKIAGIQSEDMAIMVNRALKEANPLYPVPKLLFETDMNQLFWSIKE